MLQVSVSPLLCVSRLVSSPSSQGSWSTTDTTNRIHSYPVLDSPNCNSPKNQDPKSNLDLDRSSFSFSIRRHHLNFSISALVSFSASPSHSFYYKHYFINSQTSSPFLPPFVSPSCANFIAIHLVAKQTSKSLVRNDNHQVSLSQPISVFPCSCDIVSGIETSRVPGRETFQLLAPDQTRNAVTSLGSALTTRHYRRETSTLQVTRPTCRSAAGGSYHHIKRQEFSKQNSNFQGVHLPDSNSLAGPA